MRGKKKKYGENPQGAAALLHGYTLQSFNGETFSCDR